jgi:hypothetical protein
MMRRLAAGVAAAALGATVLAGAAAPAMASSADDGGHTSLSFDVNPEPAWRGQPVTVSGRLSVRCDEDYIKGFVVVHHANHCADAGSWDRLGWKSIAILFQPAGSGEWHHVRSVKTGRDGSFVTRVRAYESGTWRAVFEGSRHLESSTATDWVKVIGHHRNRHHH